MSVNSPNPEHDAGGGTGGRDGGGPGVPPRLTATFIQLTRAVATNSVAEWQADLNRLKALGIDTVIVQWTAEPPVAYFQADTNELRQCCETYGTLENFFEAVKGTEWPCTWA